MPPVIDPNKCKRCDKCVDICSEDVFFSTGKRQLPIITYPEACWYCNCCVEICPVKGAIKLRIPLTLSLCYK